MAPKSPTHAFDPTPALEHHPENFSPLNRPRGLSSSDDAGNGCFKGVRFSETPTLPPKGRHSIATTSVPLLPPVPSASQLPKHGIQIANPTPEIDITAYMEQCRLWNTQLRESHESERKAWDIERSALKVRIAELEQKLHKVRDPTRRSSNDSSSTSMHSFMSDFQPFVPNGKHRARFSSEASSSEPPIWKGPETTPPVTRVFSHEEHDLQHLPSIAEDGAFPSLTKEISPSSKSQEFESIPVPVEQVDKTLDGITLRSAALTSSFDKDITSPQFVSPSRSPSQMPDQPTDKPLQLDVKNLLSPLDEKLKRHAGHTPMAFDGTLSSDAASTAPLTPKQEVPAEPAPTKRSPIRPSENSDSYFSFSSAPAGQNEVSEENATEGVDQDQQPIHEPEDDPALEGPLMLDSNAKTVQASSFLSQVDAKLIDEVEHRSRAESMNSTDGNAQNSSEQTENPSAPEDDMPRLRIRNSSNFGSAWGGDRPGNV